jgi:hypothetical protein
MKRAVLLHGTDGNPQDQWFPWLRKQLEQSSYSIYAPSLPENHTPDREKYSKFLHDSGWDFTDNILVGHSSGATTVLNLLSEDRFPKVKAVILLGTFLNEKLLKDVSWYEPGQFDNLFLADYDADKIKQKAGGFYFVHGDNDPFCDINDARNLSKKVGGKFITIKNGHHLGGTSGITEIPPLIDALKADSIL